MRIEFASVRRDYVEKGIYTVGRQPMFSGHGTDPERMKMALQLGASARERLQRAAALRPAQEETPPQASDFELPDDVKRLLGG